MHLRRRTLAFAVVLLLAVLLPLPPAQAATATFSNPASITIPAAGTDGPANPYPSTIGVSGLTGTIAQVTVTLNGVSHTYPGDLYVLLVSPGGQTSILMADAGESADIVLGTLTFDDFAAQAIPEGGPLVSGTYRPSDWDSSSDSLAAPAPARPYGATLGVFNGSDPNGTWSLYVWDDSSGDIGAIGGGWSLTITTNASTPVVAPPWSPGDGRLNPEPAAPLAIYCDADSVYAYQPGFLEFDFALDQVGEAGASTLLTTGVSGARLYHLNTGELQVNFLHGSEEYVFTWDACPATRAITRVYDAATRALLAEYPRTY
jgi:subtilisin-like proprotein convertase family protein